MDRLTGLKIFVAAVDEGSLAGAARRLGMTPAMAGKHLAAIEASLDARLLHRTTRRLRLTSAGEDYYQRSRSILESLDEADRAAREQQDDPRGVLRITAPTSFSALHLGRPVAEFLRRCPGVTVEMSLEDRFANLVAGGYDLAIRIGTLSDSSLIARRFALSRMIACATPALLDAHGRPDTPAALRPLGRLTFSRATSAGDWGFTDPGGGTHTLDGPVRLLADNMQMLLGAALAGAGVVYGPAFVLEPHVASGALEQVLPDHVTESIGIHAVYPSARLVGAKVRRFVDLLDDWFSTISGWGEKGSGG